MSVAPEPPPGFRPLRSRSPFVIRAGSFFQRDNGDGTRSIGSWVTEDQANSEHYAHGGFLLTFADFALTIVTNAITVNITADFLRPGRVGDWIEAAIKVRKRSETLVFADAIVTSGGHELMRVSGVFRPFEKRS